MKQLIAVIIFNLFGGIVVWAQQTPSPNITAPNDIEVNALSGNLHHLRTDLKIPGTGIYTNLSFSYNSSLDTLDYGYGYGWTFSYHLMCEPHDSGAVVLHSNGRRDSFLLSNSVYVAPRGVFDQLEEYESNKFRLVSKNGLNFFFEDISHHKLTKIEDTNDNALVLNYVGGEISTLTNPSGRTQTFLFENDRLKQITDLSISPNRTLTYTYDVAGNMIESTDPEGQTMNYAYGNQHEMNQVIDKRGSEVSIIYDNNSRVQKVISCLGSQTITYIEDKVFLVEKNEGQIRRTHYLLDTLGRMIGLVNPAGNEAKFAYDTDNNLKSYTDFNGSLYFYSYDAKGNLLSQTDPMGKNSVYTYDPVFNQMTSSRDRNNNETIFSYNPATGDRIGISAPEGVAESMAYDSKGNLLSSISPTGEVMNYTYNGIGNLTAIQMPIGTINYEYDGAGNLTKFTDANNNSIQFEFDQLNRLVKLIDALGFETLYSYDANGNVTSETNSNGDVKTYEYDFLGRIVSFTEPTGTWNYEYDYFGNLIKSIDANDNITSYDYNDQNLVSAVTDANGNKTSFSYDVNGNLLEKNLPNGKSITYTYDLLNRPISQSYLENTDNFEYDSEGNLIRASNNDITVTLTYDNLNRLINKNISNWGKSVSYTYDAAGNRKTMTDPDGGLTSYVYDDNYRLISLTNPFGETTSFTYDVGGRLIQRDNANGTYIKYELDAAGKISKVSHFNAINDTLSSYTYTYDNAGNRLSMKDQNGVNSYVYNDGNLRLTDVNYSNGDSEGFNYDNVGNRTQHTINGTPSPYTYDDANMLITAGADAYDFDVNGNMISKNTSSGLSTFEYDAFNRLCKVNLPNGANNEFRYDPFGNRISLTDTTGIETRFFNDGLNTLLELDDSGNTTTHYTANAGLDQWLTMRKNGQSYSYHQDAIGNIIGLADGSGNMVKTYQYDAFGAIKSQSGNLKNPYTFTGQRFDAQTGLYYHRLRYYDNKTGRFINRDPLDFSTGENLYAYVYNNPLNWRDPLGLYSFDEFLYDASNFSAGFGDAVSFGLTQKVRQWGGYDHVVNKNSGLYVGGEVAGTGVSLFLPLGPAKGASLAMRGATNARIAAEAARTGKTARAALKALESRIRSQARNLMGRGAKMGDGLAVHHRWALKGHPGGIASHFPTLGLPAWLYNSRRNLAVLDRLAHNAAHRAARGLEWRLLNIYDRILMAELRILAGGGNEDDLIQQLLDLYDEFNIPRVHAVDPNEISGPIGYDTAQWVSINDNLGYTIFYENDPEFATAPAQIVEIRMPVDSNLNIFSVRLGDFGFGYFSFEVPENTTFYQERLDVIDSLNVYVDVTAGIDVVSNEVFWIFESIDPLTGLPPEDALTGFLPVNDTTTLYNDTIPKEGEGFVRFTIKPKNTLLTGDTVRTQASIIFDINAPLETNTWTNLVDAFGPVSQIDTIFDDGDTYSMIWSGVDDVGGVGIDYYDLFVSQDDGPFLLYDEKIDTTIYTFPLVVGSTYSFYIRATDNVGNRETEKYEADDYVLLARSIKVAAKVFLQGPYDVSTGLMKDQLREGDLIPVSEPFTNLGFTHVDGGGGELVAASVFDTTGNNAIVDWIFLELRDQNKPDSIVATRAALLQVDGDIVDVDGSSAVSFSGQDIGDYYLAVRHRNHLGIRTAAPVSLSGVAGLPTDFTDINFATFGINAQVEINGVNALYAGNANHDAQINAVDKNAYWSIQNGQLFDYLTFTADFNLDGAVNAVDKNLYWRVNNSRIQQLD